MNSNPSHYPKSNSSSLNVLTKAADEVRAAEGLNQKYEVKRLLDLYRIAKVYILWEPTVKKPRLSLLRLPYFKCWVLLNWIRCGCIPIYTTYR